MLKLYNTLSRKIKEFRPLKKGHVKIYHCGPTVYWTQHIGNLRGMFCADVVVRTFKYLGYKTKLVRNYTDVGHLTSDADVGEDKMAKAAKREKLTPEKIAKKYIKIFEQDTSELNIIQSDVKPLATKHIKEMINMVKTLLDKGYAYSTDLAVYFDVSKAKDYTSLSGQKLEEQKKGAGKGEVEDPNKKNPTDFALWFFKAGKHKDALQTWSSPFVSPLVKNGEGFPGWHIECSAMSKKYLGDTFDIHMGGVEHISIHHTNEIAQSEAANDSKFVNYWLHNEHLLVNGRKMAKSEGTGYSLEEVEQKGFEPLVLRYFFLQAQYRSKQNFTWEALEASRNGLEHLRNQVQSLGKKKGKVSKDFKEEFIKRISDDFNTPQALALVQEVLKSNLSNEDKLATILDFDKVFGLDLDKVKKIKIPADIKKLVKDREKVREKKDFKKSDEIRDELAEKGWEVEDTKDGSIVKKI